jgi:fluoride exporter
VRVFVQILLVALGSALGGLTRWGVSLTAGRFLGSAFPWGTFLINITGSLFLGWFSTLLTDRILPENSWLSPDDLRLMLAVGFTGAYTTFSTFEYESDKMLREGDGFLAMIYLFGSVFLGLVAVRAGMWLARWR